METRTDFKPEKASMSASRYIYDKIQKPVKAIDLALGLPNSKAMTILNKKRQDMKKFHTLEEPGFPSSCGG
jgi:hypothetical protein